MRAASEWVPAEWPSSWGPERIDRLRGTPVNCLVTAQPAGEALRAAAARQGIDCVTVAQAENAGVVRVSGAWPQVKSSRKDGTSEAGPTGPPWVDSNGWAVQLSRTRHPGKPVWVEFERPKEAEATAEATRQAVADAAVRGGRWVVAPPEPGSPAWSALTEALGFFEKHRAWAEFQPAARLAVISTFSGDDEFLAGELLNLAARRNLSFRACDPGEAEKADFADLRAVVYASAKAPSPALVGRLRGFVAGGGLLFVQPGWRSKLETRPAASRSHPRFEFGTLGKGTVAVARQDWDDPWVLAADTHVILSHRYDVFRLFNPGSTIGYASRPAKGGEVLVQLIRFASRGSASDMTVWAAGKAASARVYTLAQPEGRQVQPQTAVGGAEVSLPPFRDYAAVLFSRA